MTGQQGPPGASAASAATTAFGPSKYTNGFTISAEADTRGNYELSGTIQNEQVTTGPHNATFFVRCALLAGPPNGTATELTESTTYYVYNRHKHAFQPSGFDGPDALSFVGRSVGEPGPARGLLHVQEGRPQRQGHLHAPGADADRR